MGVSPPTPALCPSPTAFSFVQPVGKMLSQDTRLGPYYISPGGAFVLDTVLMVPTGVLYNSVAMKERR